MPDLRAGGTLRRVRRLSLLLSLASLAACDAPFARGSGDSGPLPGAPDEARFTAPSPPPLSADFPGGGVPLFNRDPDGAAVLRFDLAGANLDAHEGEIERFGDRYYLYGGTYDCGFHLARPGTPFCGFKVYSSPDLIEWTDHGLLFPPESESWQRRCNGTMFGCYRPHVARNARTGRYVLWINTYDIPVGFRVFESASPVGPFVERAPPTLALMSQPGTRNGDENLFVDRDGVGYLAYTDWSVGGDLIVEELTPDFLSGTGRHVRLGLRAVEAPAIFERRGRYYLTFADPNCGYCGAGGSYMTAPSPLGPWTGRAAFARPCAGQPSDVAMLPSTSGDTVFLYQGDLWNDLEPNQATAAHFWAPLEFDAAGAIRPLDCTGRLAAPIVTAPRTRAGEVTAARMRLACDVGGPGDRAVDREIRFVAPRRGRLRGFALPLFRKGTPGGPLRVELSGAAGPVRLIRIEPERLSYSARRRYIETDLRLEAGRGYSIRFSAPAGEGCYGFAYYAAPAAGQPHTLQVRRSPAGAWEPRDGEVLRLDLWIDPS